MLELDEQYQRPTNLTKALMKKIWWLIVCSLVLDKVGDGLLLQLALVDTGELALVCVAEA
jgi:hypothetical protein